MGWAVNKHKTFTVAWPAGVHDTGVICYTCLCNFETIRSAGKKMAYKKVATQTAGS